MSPNGLRSGAVSGAGPAAGGSFAESVLPDVGMMVPPIICTVRYTRTWRASPSPTARHASITGASNPPAPIPPPV